MASTPTQAASKARTSTRATPAGAKTPDTKPAAAKSAAKAAQTTAAGTAPAAVAKKSAAAAKASEKMPKQAKQPKVAAKEKVRKPKLVRDSFTMPEDEYAVLSEVKKACLKAGLAVKKTELLRVGIALLRELDLDQVGKKLAALPVLKSGRPKKTKPA